MDGGQSQPQCDQPVIEKNAVPQWKTMHCLDSREQRPELPDSGSLAVFYNSEL